MVVARLPTRLDHIQKQRRGFQAGAGTELTDHGAVDFLPRRHGNQLRRRPGGFARGELTLGDQHVDFSCVQVDAWP